MVFGSFIFKNKVSGEEYFRIYNFDCTYENMFETTNFHMNSVPRKCNFLDKIIHNWHL